MKRRNRLAVFGALRRHRQGIVWSLVLNTLLLAWAPLAEANVGATLPLVENNGAFSCPTCTTNASALTSNAVVVGAGSQATSIVTLNATGTKKYLSQTSSGAPSFDQPAITELSAFSSANLASVLSDETGSGGGFVRATGPTVDAPVFTTSVDLPAGAVDAIGEIASGIKQGTSGGTKLATTTGTAGSNGNYVKWDTNGNLIDGGSTVGVTPFIPSNPLTSVTVASGTPVYCGLDGSCSITTDGTDVQTPVKSASTFTNLDWQATAGTGQQITAVLGVGTCNSTLNFSSKAQVIMSATAWTAGTISGSTAVTAGQCVVYKLTVSSSTSNKVVLRGGIEKSA